MKKQLEEIMISVEQGEDALKEMSYLLKRVNELHSIATNHYDDVKYKIKNLRPTITSQQPTQAMYAPEAEVGHISKFIVSNEGFTYALMDNINTLYRDAMPSRELIHNILDPKFHRDINYDDAVKLSNQHIGYALPIKKLDNYILLNTLIITYCDLYMSKKDMFIQDIPKEIKDRLDTFRTDDSYFIIRLYTLPNNNFVIDFGDDEANAACRYMSVATVTIGGIRNKEGNMNVVSVIENRVTMGVYINFAVLNQYDIQKLEDECVMCAENIQNSSLLKHIAIGEATEPVIKLAANIPQPYKAGCDTVSTQADLSAKHPSSVPNKYTVDRDVTPVPHDTDCRYENIDNMVGALIADGTLKKYAYREDGNALSFMKDVSDFIRGVQYLKMVPLSSTFSKSTISTWMLVFHQLYLSKDGSRIEIAKDVKYPFCDNKHFTLKLVDWDNSNTKSYDDSLNDMRLIHIAGIQSGTSTDYDVSVIICKPNGDVYMKYLQLTKMTVDTLCKLASNIKNIHTHSFLMSIIADIDKAEPTFKLVKPEVDTNKSIDIV